MPVEPEARHLARRGFAARRVKHTAPHGLRLLAHAVACATAFGCAAERTPISTKQPAPLPASLQPDESVLFGGRFVAIPVKANQESDSLGIASFQYPIAAGAWSGLSGGYVEAYVNLRIVDLESRRCDAVFDRQVALGTLAHSRDQRWQSHYPNQLLLVARAADSNRDTKIDQADETHVFTYDMAQRKLTQVTPAGWSVETLVEISDTLTIIVRAADGKYAVCRGLPSTGAAQVVVDSIAP